MDELDKKLFKDLSNKIDIPIKYDYFVKNTLKNLNKCTRKKYNNSIIKTLLTACAGIILTTGIVIASTMIYNNIWNEPQKIEQYYNSDGTVNLFLEEEEKENTISEKEALYKAEQILKLFGYDNEKINNQKLNNDPMNDSLTWEITTNTGLYIEIDAKNPKSYRFFTNVLEKNIQKYRGTEKEIKKIAKDLCEKYGYDINEYNNLKITKNEETEEDSYIWYVDFSKEYDGIINKYQSISIGLVPEINEIYYFTVDDTDFENNEVIITEEEAKNIVMEKEKNIDTGYNIINIKSKIGIAKMNGIAHIREKDYEQYYEQTHTPDYPLEKIIYYRTNNLVRKVWLVTVEYDVLNKDDESFTYFVDCTTGEIIGGSELYKI